VVVLRRDFSSTGSSSRDKVIPDTSRAVVLSSDVREVCRESFDRACSMSTRRRSPRACASRTATAAAGRRSASFARRPRGLITLADWLRSWAVTVVGMESTGDYWRKTRQFVNHYSFHIMDPTWGHVTIKISGHPPFGAQVILNGHEYVACAGEKAALGFAKEGNCFIHSGQRARAPGSDRRHLVRSRDDRAPEPGHRPVDLHRVLVLRAQHRPTAAKPLCLGLLEFDLQIVNAYSQ
jgi:hypothetical protein